VTGGKTAKRLTILPFAAKRRSRGTPRAMWQVIAESTFLKNLVAGGGFEPPTFGL
jgi:hypothetical protein